jgi:hypothetical protein
MTILQMLANAGAEISYRIPTDLYDQILVLSDRRKSGENVTRELNALIRVLHKRRGELGAIAKLPHGTEIHIGVRQ